MIEDLERVTWDGEWVNKNDSKLSHLSDALGYVVAQEFGMKPKGGYGPGRVV